ncbi:MAG: hypothetical protein Q7S44_00830 [bacterium]|nr:hypothetical protein [bacterium]
MMEILPIKHLNETDQPFFGANFINLGKLARSGFPVASGFVICPPEILLQTILKHFSDAQKEVFEQRLELVKAEIIKIKMPPELEKETSGRESFYFKGEILESPKTLWLKLLQLWLEEIKTKLWRHGFGEGITLNLSPQAVFLMEKSPGSKRLLKRVTKILKRGERIFTVSAYFEPEFEEVVIKSSQDLTPSQLKKIDELVLEANKKLFLPQIYEFLIEGERLQLIGISPYTQTLPASKDRDVVIPKAEQQRLVKSTVKLFLNLSSGFAIDTSVDGILIEGERVKGFDETVFKLTEGALTFPEKPVIYKLPDVAEGDIRGTLRLLHDKKLLEEASGSFLFARNKKNLLNLEVALPYVRSCEEFLQLKRELAVKGITRKGTLKLWLELAIPENVVNLESYLTAGLNGVLLNLDELQRLLGGHGFEAGEFYKREVWSLVKFIQPIFRILHRANIPVLVLGGLSLHPDVLDCLISEGVYGVVVNTLVEAQSVPDHLHWAERRMVEKRFLNSN